MMNSKQRRYSANLHRRYREDLQQLRHRVRELLTEDMLDQLGREMAHYIAGYRDAHDAGPTRRELCDLPDLPDRFAPAPDGRPALTVASDLAGHRARPAFRRYPTAGLAHLHPAGPLARPRAPRRQDGPDVPQQMTR